MLIHENAFINFYSGKIPEAALLRPVSSILSKIWIIAVLVVSLSLSLSLSLYIYIYMYTHTHTHMYTYICSETWGSCTTENVFQEQECSGISKRLFYDYKKEII
jgi:hypothetical protein